MMVELLNPVGGLTEEKIRHAEKRLGVTLPAEYRDFLLNYNGGRPNPARFDIQWRPDQQCASDWKTSEISRFLAIHVGEKANLIIVNEVDFRGRLPVGTIAIAQDPGGNVILLAVDGPLINRILFWVKDYEAEEGTEPGFDNVGLIADSFNDLLNNKLH